MRKILALTAALMASPVLAETHGYEHGNVHHAPPIYRQYHPGYAYGRGCCWAGGSYFAPGVALGALGLGAYLGSGAYQPPPLPPVYYAPAQIPLYYPPPVYQSAPYYPPR